jgi:hypothetical protein
MTAVIVSVREARQCGGSDSIMRWVSMVQPSKVFFVENAASPFASFEAEIVARRAEDG